jgi:DNA-binding NtrC family response regulator
MDRLDSLLLVEDNDSLRSVLTNVLESGGFSVFAVPSAEDALQLFSTESIGCVLADFKLPRMHGIDLLKKIHESSPHLPFVIMTAYGSIDVAVEAMKCGASDFITKPFDPETIASLLRQVMQHNRIVDRSSSSRKRSSHGLITASPKLGKILEQARRVAAVDSPVLLLGESGSGKEVLARYIHDHSRRHEKPFIAVNCGAIPAELLESEFFGHEAGAFTGATQSRVGIFELGSDGTVFLDEVGEMPPHLQVKLLRVLQEHEIRKVGGSKTIRVNPRIVAATNRPMQEAIERGQMREDFYYRIAVVSLGIPPLRDRKEDIVDLAQSFAQHFAALNGRRSPAIDPLSLDILMAYEWPGNVRELENVIERAVLLADTIIKPEHLGIQVCLNVAILDEATKTLSEVTHAAVRHAEGEAIQRALILTEGNKARAAEMLGVSYKTLLTKVKEYRLSESDGVDDTTQ